LFSRNRSTSGVKPYIRATCNPDCDSFVADLIAWWIDQDTGYPIPERSGVIRYMGRLNDAIIWGDSPEEVVENSGGEIAIEDVKSFTFISSKLSDNKILMETNPGYLANLKALSTVERERLLEGNWKIRPAAGLYFKRSRVNMLEELPNDIVKIVRAWDLAATEDKKDTKPEDGAAYTAGVLMGKRRNGRYVVIDVINQRMNAADVRNTVLNTARADKARYKRVRVRMNQDPGQAGKEQADQYLKMLAGFSVNIERESGSKETRAEPFSAQWLGLPGSETGNVDVMVADWNEAYFSQLESFPESKFKDMVDASGTAFNELEKWGGGSLPGADMANANRTNPWSI
jgi:predicted phage terminase large subunit-like protein